MKRCRAVAYRNHVGRAGHRGQPPLELRDMRSLHQLPRAKHLDDCGEIFVGDVRRRDPDHVRIREDRDGPAVLVFDWNDGGWGVPALDAAKFLGYTVRPDLLAYQAAVKSEPAMAMPAATDLDTICRLGFVGEACRSIASAWWEAEKLAYEWIERPMASLRLYAAWVADVVRAEPWAEHPAGGAEARIPRPRAWY